MLFSDVSGQHVDAPADSGPLDYADVIRESGLPLVDQIILLLLERWSYSVDEIAELVSLSAAAVRKRFWTAREKLRSERPESDTEALLKSDPTLLPRDICALRLISDGYSYGRIAKVLGVNKGHLCRRVNEVVGRCKIAGDPRAKT